MPLKVVDRPWPSPEKKVEQEKQNEVQKTLDIIATGAFEIRALKTQLKAERFKGTVYGYFDSVDSCISELRRIQSAEGIYVTLNPVLPALLARANNHLKYASKGDPTTIDKDVERRRRLLIDVDAERPAGVSATDLEKEAAFSRAGLIMAFLREHNWPDPIFADSGNGAHLIYAIDLACNDQKLVEHVLYSLADRFDGDGAKLDRTVHNPARIVRLHGTLAAKGDNLPERPHRLSKIIHVPESLDVVSADLMLALVKELQPPPKQKVSNNNKPGPEQIREMLRAIPGRPVHAEWTNYIAAVADALPDSEAIVLLQERWPEEQEGEYELALKHRKTEVHIGTLIKRAQEHGWKFPQPAEKPKDQRAKLTIRTIDEILEMKFDSGDFVLRNGYLTKGDLTAICGMGGVGKSRLNMQLFMCCRVNKDFLGWKTNGENLNFLFLQTENSCRRLQSELPKMLSAFTVEEQQHIKEGLFFHTLEEDDDGFLMLDFENLGRVSSAINRTNAHVISFDPLRDFSLDDLNSDKVMGETLRSISRVTKHGNPKRTPLAIHHALSGKYGAQKASGWDRSSFGRNSKVLQIVARAQINVAPAKGEDNRVLIIASGKCNNAKEFPPFAVRLSFDTMLYTVDEDIDIERWREEVSEQKTGHVNPRILREVLAPDTHYERVELVEILKDEPVEVQKTRAYEIIRQATAQKILKFHKVTKTYTVIPA